MKTKLLVIFLLIIGMLSSCAGNDINSDTSYDESNDASLDEPDDNISDSDYPLYSISQIKEIDQREKNSEERIIDNFRIEGFLIEKNSCPPCPPDAQCKICANDYLIISNDPSGENSLRLEHQAYELFDDLEVGKKYIFYMEAHNNNPRNKGKRLKAHKLLE